MLIGHAHHGFWPIFAILRYLDADLSQLVIYVSKNLLCMIFFYWLSLMYVSFDKNKCFVQCSTIKVRTTSIAWLINIGLGNALEFQKRPRKYNIGLFVWWSQKRVHFETRRKEVFTQLLNEWGGHRWLCDRGTKARWTRKSGDIYHGRSDGEVGSLLAVKCLLVQ